MGWSTLGAAVVALVAGCYRPTIAENVPCGLGDTCPDGQRCDVDGRCRSSPLGVIDAPIADTADAPADDAPADGVHLDAMIDGHPLDASLDASPDASLDAYFADAAIDAPVDAPPTPWSIVQTSQSTTATNAPMKTGAGHLILVAVQTNENPVASVTDNVGNTYVAVPQGRAVDTSDNLGVELWYAKDAKSGVFKIVANAPTVYAVVVWEVANISTTSPFDAQATLDTQPTSTMPIGAGVTTSKPGEFVVAVAMALNQITEIHPGNEFTNDVNTLGNGWAHLTDNAAPAGLHVAVWDQPSGGTYCASTAAFFVGP